MAAFLICLFIYAGSVFVAALSLVSAVRSGDAAEVMAVRICRASGIRSSTSHNFWSALRTGNDPVVPGLAPDAPGPPDVPPKQRAVAILLPAITSWCII
ncbi:hypothetical protein BSZ22_05230 [Bradyrhizobium canariense]|nr:hypothetical protein BSZ22_05230 [Bradyrhizobium canariense]OSI79057.1 hypothetical protein BSZ23_16720 [Bradyrhizobium canariense]